MEIIENLFTKNNCYKTAKKMTPKGIVIHSTGCNNPNLKRYCDNEELFGKNIYGNHWNNPTPSGQSICCHGFIGLDVNKEVKVVHTLPYNYCCWNCGSGSKGSYNFSPAYIQFEICEDDLTDKIYFTNVFNATVEYCAYLVKEFNIPIENIVSHKEANKLGYASGHGDPDHWLAKFGMTMDDIRDRIEKAVNGDKIEVVECTKKFKATSSARIRKDKDINSTSLGSCVKGTIYDVNEITYINGILKWIKHNRGGYSMYVDTDNVTKLFSEVYTLQTKKTSAKCNFRSEMSTSSKVIEIIPLGTKIQVVKYSEAVVDGKTWYKVKYNGKYGYLAKECIEM